MKDNEQQTKKGKKTDSHLKWIIEVFIITFISSICFSYISTNGVSKLSIIPALIILFVVIFAGIFFDIIGVAVTVANEEEFHAKATKKAMGAKMSLKLIKNSVRVANVCADVIGDICRSIKWSNKRNDISKTLRNVWHKQQFTIHNKCNCCSTDSRRKSNRQRNSKPQFNSDSIWLRKNT